MFEDIPGMFKKILRNVRKDPRNVQEDSGECLRGFPEMFKKILGNAQEDFRESKFRFNL